MTAASGKSRPQKTAVLVAQRIVADINHRGNREGDRLPREIVMAEKYEVGRVTLREALRFLELQGMIVLKPGPGGGPVVRRPDGSNLTTALSMLLQFEGAPFRMMVEARTGLEPMVARLSAERMTDEEAAHLKATIDVMESSLDRPDQFVRANKEFHDLIARGSGNSMFAVLIDALLGILDSSAVGGGYGRQRAEGVIEAHRAIYEAIVARDPAAAWEAMFRHVQEYLDYAEQRYPDVMAAPIVWGETV